MSTEKQLINAQLFEMKRVLELCCKEECEADFIIYSLTNIDLIDDRLKKLDELKKPTPAYEKYMQSKLKIANECCYIDEHGNLELYTDATFKTRVPKTATQGQPKPKSDKKAEYDKRNKDLEKENDKVVEAQNKKFEKYNKALMDEIKPSINFVKIPRTLVPKLNKSVALNYIKVLMPLLEPLK